MKIHIKIILDTRSYSKKNSGHPIKIRVQGHKRKYVNLYKYSEKKHWLDGLVSNKHPQSRILNDFLKKRAFVLEDEIQFIDDNNLDFEKAIEVLENGIEENDELKIFLLEQQIAKLRKKNSVGMIEFFDIRIEELKKEGKNIGMYKATKSQLQKYIVKKDIPFNQVGREFVIGFKDFKTKEGCGLQGIRTYLTILAAFYKEAAKRKGTNVSLPFPAKDLIPNKVRREKIIIPERKKVLKLLSYDTVNTKLSLFQFLIGGQDLIDIALFKWTDMQKGRVILRRRKNVRHDYGGAEIDNFLCKEAKETIKEIGTKDKERVFGFIPSPIKKRDSYDYYRDKVRWELTKKSEEIGFKYGTKSPRFIFKTFAVIVGVDVATTKVLQGHSNTSDGSTAFYQGKIPYKVQDAKHQKIIDYLFKG